MRHSTHRFGETLYIPDANGCTAMFLAAKHETVVSSSTIASLHSSFSPEVVNLLQDFLRILSKYCDLDEVGLDMEGRTIIDVATPACKQFLKTIGKKFCLVMVTSEKLRKSDWWILLQKRSRRSTAVLLLTNRMRRMEVTSYSSNTSSVRSWFRATRLGNSWKRVLRAS